MKNRVEEIRTFIEYKDFDLARRRLLDACLDTRKESLIQQSINFSKQVGNKAEQNLANFSDKFQDGAEQILQQFSSLSSSVIHTNEQVISANKISKSYTVGGFNLQALSLKAYTNKIIGVVGENGHGKTTLLRCLAGQLQINEGSIDYYFDPKPDYFSIKQKVAFIPQRIPKWYGKLKDN
ncbi:MAG TPA: ATP-binding cassette domain-containing protein, partial [Chitinophagaceae bacterium]|nr:ATP-binding cassette domain-containing protein [Chitinophagaceae bacterium]